MCEVALPHKLIELRQIGLCLQLLKVDHHRQAGTAANPPSTDVRARLALCKAKSAPAPDSFHFGISAPAIESQGWPSSRVGSKNELRELSYVARAINEQMHARRHANSVEIDGCLPVEAAGAVLRLSRRLACRAQELAEHRGVRAVQQDTNQRHVGARVQ
eukprot:scaffold14138_cov61-Phaeocystis_antarctica.AAC.4